MQRPDMKTPRAVGARGVGEAGQASNLKTDGNAHGARQIAQRRADSLRLQAIGQSWRTP